MKQYHRQINRLMRLGIPSSFGLDKERSNFESWLAQFGIVETSLSEERSFIILPSNLIRSGTVRGYWFQLCPNLKLNVGITGEVMNTKDLPSTPYVLAGVSFDIWSRVANQLIEDRGSLEEELRTADRDGLTGEELIGLLAYDYNHFDVMLALGSISIGGVIPYLSPISGRWELSLKPLDDLVGKEGQWKPPFGGACPITVPTARRLFPVSA